MEAAVWLRINWKEGWMGNKKKGASPDSISLSIKGFEGGAFFLAKSGFSWYDFFPLFSKPTPAVASSSWEGDCAGA